MVSTNRFEDLKVDDARRADVRRRLFLAPLPFVCRVVLIATPHRGSYLAGGFVRGFARRFVSLPGALVSRSSELIRVVEGSAVGRFFRGWLPTSLDGMFPRNPGLIAMSEIPILPPIKGTRSSPSRGTTSRRTVAMAS